MFIRPICSLKNRPGCFVLHGDKFCAIPRTAWLPAEIERDTKGFVKTSAIAAQSKQWRRENRPPFFLETSRAGVFAARDIRSDSVKHVASAVGEGSMAVPFAHEYLKEIQTSAVVQV